MKVTLAEATALLIIPCATGGTLAELTVASRVYRDVEAQWVDSHAYKRDGSRSCAMTKEDLDTCGRRRRV